MASCLANLNERVNQRSDQIQRLRSISGNLASFHGSAVARSLRERRDAAITEFDRRLGDLATEETRDAAALKTLEGRKIECEYCT